MAIDFYKLYGRERSQGALSDSTLGDLASRLGTTTDAIYEANKHWINFSGGANQKVSIDALANNFAGRFVMPGQTPTVTTQAQSDAVRNQQLTSYTQSQEAQAQALRFTPTTADNYDPHTAAPYDPNASMVKPAPTDPNGTAFAAQQRAAGIQLTPNQNYYLKPGETVTAYNARIAPSNSPQAQGNGNISSANLSYGSSPSYQTAPTLSYDSTGLYAPTESELRQSEIGRQTQGLNNQEATKDQFTNEQNNLQGITGKTQLVNDLVGQMEILNREAVNIQAKQQLAGSGVTSAIDARQRQEALRLNSINQLQVQANLNAAKGNLATAQALADKAVAAKFDPIEAQIKANLANLEILRNDPLTSLAEKKRADAQTATQNQIAQAVAQQKADAGAIWELTATAIQNGLTDARVLQKVQGTTDKNVALQLLAPYLQPKPNLPASAEEYNFAVQNGYKGSFTQYQNEDANRKAAVARAGVASTAQITAALTPEQQSDPFVKLLASTAGGKPITDTFAQSLNKGLNVLGQIGGLQTNIANTNTGPILGAFRGANPWDTNAQTIKAQLNAIVPNLARGVYGEVGVLTDNDITQYSKTLPTLTSTEDIRNAVLGITVDLIGKSIKRTLEINAANQKDVSGFIDIYTEMNRTRDSIFAQIPGYTGSGAVKINKDDEGIFDSVIGTTIVEDTGGFWGNLWKGLTGT